MKPTNKELRKEINYLPDKEFNEMEAFKETAGLLQYTLGLESCKSKKDAVDLLLEIFKHGQLKGRQEALEEVKKIMPTNWLDMPDWVFEKLKFKPIDIERLFLYFYKKIKELEE